MFYVLRDSFTSGLTFRLVTSRPWTPAQSSTQLHAFQLDFFELHVLRVSFMKALSRSTKTLQDVLRVNACKQAFIPYKAQPARVPSTGFHNPPTLQHTTFVHCDLISAMLQSLHGTNNRNSLISAILITLDPCPELVYRPGRPTVACGGKWRYRQGFGLYHSHRSASKAPRRGDMQGLPSLLRPVL